MKFPFSWLKEFIKLDLSPEKISEILTLSGIEVDALHPKDSDFLFEVSMTPNFGHALSILGIARELGAQLQEEVKIPSISLKERSEATSSKISIDIKDQEWAPRYLARVIFDVNPSAPTPDWMANRLELSGFRSVNIIVDVVNYVLMELGIPLHAFDYEKIEESKIFIRKASKNEKVITLDHQERFLSEEVGVIADSKKVLAIAGIMGALSSEVTAETHSILLEGAFFDPRSIRRASKQLDLSTESSRRFERGVDYNGIEYALDRAAFLIQTLANASPLKGRAECGKAPSKRVISLRVSEIRRIVGISLSENECESLLKRLYFKTHSSHEKIEVEVPSFRSDVKDEIDLVEEIARLYGYNNIYLKGKKPFYRSSAIPSHPLYKFSKEMVQRLLGEGLTEIVTCDLISEKKARAIMQEDLQGRSLVKVINPHSHDQGALRPSLLPNHLEVVKHNLDYGRTSFALFEIGRIHLKEKDSFIEPDLIGITLSGKGEPLHFEKESEDFDFFDLKGILQNIFLGLKIERAEFSKSNHPSFHPGKQAKISIDHSDIGVIGEVHPDLLDSISANQPVYFAELSLDSLARHAKQEIKMKKIAAYPASQRDWTLTLNETTPFQMLFEAIESTKGPILENFSLVSIFRSDKIGANWKNVTLRFVFRDVKGTLSQTQVEEEMERMTSKVLSLLKNEARIDK